MGIRKKIAISTALFFFLVSVGFISEALAKSCAYDKPFTGLNLAGAEFGRVVPGVEGKDYFFPKNINYYNASINGFNLVRLPFLWERLQKELGASLDGQNLIKLDNAIEQSKINSMAIVLDMHNSGKYKGIHIKDNKEVYDSYLSFWKQIAARYKDEKHVLLGLMNEPIDVNAAGWATITQDVIYAVRSEGFVGTIIVSGVIYSGVHSWFRRVGALSNAEAISTLQDPSNNIAIDMHQYFDKDYSGQHKECKKNFDVSKVFKRVTMWLRRNNLKGFLGEYGGTEAPACLNAIESTLKHLKNNKDVWIGSAYWAAGSYWGNAYPLLIDFKRGIGLRKLAVIKYSSNICSGK